MDSGLHRREDFGSSGRLRGRGPARAGFRYSPRSPASISRLGGCSLSWPPLQRLSWGKSRRHYRSGRPPPWTSLAPKMQAPNPSIRVGTGIVKVKWVNIGSDKYRGIRPRHKVDRSNRHADIEDHASERTLGSAFAEGKHQPANHDGDQRESSGDGTSEGRLQDLGCYLPWILDWPGWRRSKIRRN